MSLKRTLSELVSRARQWGLLVKYFVASSLIFLLATASASALTTVEAKKVKVTREEFAASLSEVVQAKGPAWQKLLAELKNEISVIKYEKDKATFETQQSGSISSQVLLTGNQGRVDHRLKYILLKNFSKESSLRIRLDTVDAINTTRDFATRMIDIESKIKLGRWHWRVNVGPGETPHSDEFLPLDNTVYERPDSGVQVATRIGKLNFSAGYAAREMAGSGLIGAQEITSTLGYDYGDHYFYLRPHYFFAAGGGRDVLVEAGLDCEETGILLGYGGVGRYLGLTRKVGSWLKLCYSTVGRNYRSTISQNEVIPLNNFDRYIVDGSADFGVTISCQAGDRVDLELKADNVVGQGENYLVWQVRADYEVKKDMKLGSFYRVYAGREALSLLGLSLSYFL